MTNQRKYLLGGRDAWKVSACHPEWDCHSSIIKESKLTPDIMIHSSSPQQVIMVELTIPCGNRIEEAHIYKTKKYLNLTNELRDAGYKAEVVPIEVGARGFIGLSVYDSICDNKRTKALK